MRSNQQPEEAGSGVDEAANINKHPQDGAVVVGTFSACHAVHPFPDSNAASASH
jgi:hypothetical protein